MNAIDPHAHLADAKIQPLPQPVAGRVITVSDRCYRGLADDRSGPIAVEMLADYRVIADRVVVEDGVESVRSALNDALADGCAVIVTTGGTGVSPRDFTPEATAPLLTKRLDALTQQIQNYSLSKTPLAALSRALTGIAERPDGAGASVIVNCPGSPGGVRDTLTVVAPLIAHILEQCNPGVVAGVAGATEPAPPHRDASH